MRIACVNRDRGIGPGRKKGAAVHLDAMRRAFDLLGADVTPIDEFDPNRLRSELASLCERGPVDLVYERYALGESTACRYARDVGIPYALEVNAPLVDEELRWRGGGGRDGGDLERAGCVLAVSDSVADYALRHGAPKERLIVAPNAVDPALFSPKLRGSVEVDVPADAVVLGFHGRLRPWHGFDELARCFAALLERGLPVHLLVVGDGDFAGPLDGLVPADTWTHIEWVPHESLGPIVARFDLVALTYRADEPCYFSPLKLAEAMASGAVPVVPDLGDLATRVAHGRTGIVVSPGDPSARIDALERLIVDCDRRRELAAAAARAAAQHTWQGVATAVLDVAFDRGSR